MDDLNNVLVEADREGLVVVVASCTRHVEHTLAEDDCIADGTSSKRSKVSTDYWLRIMRL